MHKRILFALFVSLLSLAVQAGADGKFVLVIDAGHGGRDAGAKGRYSLEKNINLHVALAFGRYVETNCPDVKVIYTRKKDVFIPLHERANIANKNHADAFISIHTNAVEGSRTIRGFETYTMGMRRSDEKLSAAQRENSVITIEDNYQQRYAGYDPSSPESEIMFEFINDKNMEQSVNLAKLVQKNVCSTAGRPNKGVKQDVFLVLRETSMPACLIELGYISTPDEERILNDNDHLDRMAYGIYTAFVKYKDKNKAVVPPYSAPQQQRPDKVAEQQEKDRGKEQKERAEQDNERQKPETPKAERPKAETPENSVEKGKKSRHVQQTVKTVEQQRPKTPTDDDAPVFKVQFLTAPRILPAGAKQFKGLADVSHYRDGSTIKYTVGEYNNFQEANTRKREIQKLFPDAFIVALRDGERMDLNEARQWHGGKNK